MRNTAKALLSSLLVGVCLALSGGCLQTLPLQVSGWKVIQRGNGYRVLTKESRERGMWVNPTTGRGMRGTRTSVDTKVLLLTGDQNRLYEIVTEVFFSGRGGTELRLAALQKITDQALVAKVAIESKEWKIYEEAARLLTDQAALAEVAIKCRSTEVRRDAAKRLTDQATLLHVARLSTDGNVCSEVVKKLTDHASMMKMVLDPTVSSSTRFWIMCRGIVTDQAVLAKFATESDNDEYSGLRVTAVEKLTDQAVLAKVAAEDSSVYARHTAERRLKELGLYSEDVLILARAELQSKLEKQKTDVLAKVEVGMPSAKAHAALHGLGSLAPPNVVPKLKFLDSPQSADLTYYRYKLLMIRLEHLGNKVHRIVIEKREYR